MKAIVVLKMPRRFGDKLIKVRSIEDMLANYAFILSYLAKHSNQNLREFKRTS